MNSHNKNNKSDDQVIDGTMPMHILIFLFFVIGSAVSIKANAANIGIPLVFVITIVLSFFAHTKTYEAISENIEKDFPKTTPDINAPTKTVESQTAPRSQFSEKITKKEPNNKDDVCHTVPKTEYSVSYSDDGSSGHSSTCMFSSISSTFNT